MKYAAPFVFLAILGAGGFAFYRYNEKEKRLAERREKARELIRRKQTQMAVKEALKP